MSLKELRYIKFKQSMKEREELIMLTNLIPVVLTANEIVHHLDTSPYFTYNISEGGYVSNDNSVIVITDREPYVGTVLQLKEVEQNILDFWRDSLCDLFGIKP